MPTRFLIFVSLWLVAAASIFGGYRECYSYQGTIGSHPIALLMQIREGFFGEKSLADHNVLCVYKYDKTNTPIECEGIWDRRSGKVTLQEIKAGTSPEVRWDKKIRTAAFAFPFSKGKTEGTWTSLATGKSLPLKLEFVSELIDTFNIYKDSTERTPAPVEIPMRAATDTRFFMGVYEYDYPRYHYEHATMTALRVMDKKTGKILQTFAYPPRVGTYMTLIFDNAWVEKDRLYVSYDIGRDGARLEYRFDARKNAYVMTRESRELLEDE